MENFVSELNRAQKAIKIQKVLEHFTKKPLTNYRVLDIGCGNGLIAHHFVTINNHVTAVDVVDQRDLNYAKNYEFVKISDEYLPFEDNSFDIVISNHVVEHVSDYIKHVTEIARVLKPNGMCYFATPNRYFPFEVHYRLPFLHWLPQKMFIGILKLTNKYKYPVRLLGYFGLKKAFKPFFSVTEYTHIIIRDPKAFNFNKIPVLFSKAYHSSFNFISPTFVFILTKKNKL